MISSIQFNNNIRAAICAVTGAAAIAMAAERIVRSVFEKRKLDQQLSNFFTASIGSFLFLQLFPFKLEFHEVGIATLVYLFVSRFLIPAFAEKLVSVPKSDKLATPITFKDIAGNPQAKVAMETFVDYVKSFNQPNSPYSQFRIVPTGMLFYGPPGTGKTLFAQALVGETGCPFFYIRCSELYETFVGSGPKKTREYFDNANELGMKAKKPCILFIDEVDSIGMKRSDINGQDTYNTQTLASILTRLGTKEYAHVFVIMATNRKDCLDEALIRSGRLDDKIEFKLPNTEERYEILKVHLKNFNFEENNSLLIDVAERTTDFSGADLANIANQAIISAAKRGNPVTLIFQDFVSPIDKIKRELETKYPPSHRLKWLAGRIPKKWVTGST